MKMRLLLERAATYAYVTAARSSAAAVTRLDRRGLLARDQQNKINPFYCYETTARLETKKGAPAKTLFGTISA